MSIGFNLLGRFRKPQRNPDDILRALGSWICSDSSQLAPTTTLGHLDGKPRLFCSFHPAAEDVEVCVTDPDFLVVSANTSTVGPGYHIYLCDLLHRWTDEFSIEWRRTDNEDESDFCDEAGYFFSGDQESVYREHETWLRALAGCFFDGTLDADSKDQALCMPFDVQFRGNAVATTPLGPRDRDWLYRASKGDVDFRDFFSWYDRGLTATYYLGRALVQMWSQVRWRKPVNDLEINLLKSVLNSLQTAYLIDPKLRFPWSEWNELQTLIGENSPSFEFLREHSSGPPRIGYRRNQVRTRLPGNWWIETDGSFSEFQSDEDGTVSSFDPPREIWFTAYSFSAENPDTAFSRMRESALNEKHELAINQKNYAAVASVERRSNGDGEHFVLQAKNISILRRSICTLVFRDSHDRDWAVRTWKSLSP